MQPPWSPESPYITIEVPEEQPNGTVVHRFAASDVDSNIDYFEIKPKNKYFDIDRGTGELLVKSRLDYEALEEPRRVTLDLLVHDAGVPSKSAAALVVANVRNVNDQVPRFVERAYSAEVVEDSLPGTFVVQVVTQNTTFFLPMWYPIFFLFLRLRRWTVMPTTSAE